MIVIVTPSETLSSSLQRALSEYYYDSVTAKDQRGGVEQALRIIPSAILIDRKYVMFEVFRRHPELRSVPIVAIQEPTTECGEDECVANLERGLDACMCKQGSRELIARVRAILRAEQRRQAAAEVYRVGNLLMNVGRHEVRTAGKMVELTPREFEILRQLLLSPGVVMTRQELLNRVWGEDVAIEEHALDVHIHSLRRKIEPAATSQRLIVTIRGVGYKLTALGPHGV
jgi:DNA-binding response OmpR family regulator